MHPFLTIKSNRSESCDCSVVCFEHDARQAVQRTVLGSGSAKNSNWVRQFKELLDSGSAKNSTGVRQCKEQYWGQAVQRTIIGLGSAKNYLVQAVQRTVLGSGSAKDSIWVRQWVVQRTTWMFFFICYVFNCLRSTSLGAEEYICKPCRVAIPSFYMKYLIPTTHDNPISTTIYAHPLAPSEASRMSVSILLSAIPPKALMPSVGLGAPQSQQFGLSHNTGYMECLLCYLRVVHRRLF